ncbi:peptidylprolyl isomerase [uncultured Lentibacter sp.]|uniref:peptidylprolyl isomerase n=1 Tax=uncultured Lentibacter sp. TaxID=1659309 RepID=UPI00260DEAD0|nr:peptidylprolyl isomerase [uncultured Lentibacter sp.]MCW1954347.1 peptidylprolyl isomerase [Roseobacter sp.]
MMSKHFKIMSLVLAGALASAPAFADDTAPNPSTVVATVNGTKITLGHMAVARSGLPEQYLQLPDDVLFKAILDQLVNQTILADRFDGDLPTPVQRRLDNERRSLVASTVIEQIVEEKLTDDALKAAYSAKYSNATPDKEFKAAHILVETEEDAKTLIAELAAGADFSELAKERSTGPSGPNGGDLGWFSKGMMVPPFEDAVAAMEDGAISEPVQTQFGWHVIKLNETRLADLPQFEEVRAELESELFNTVIEAEVARLKKLGSIDQIAEGEIDPAVLKEDVLLTE